MELCFITSNKNKLEEVRRMLGVRIASRSLEIEEVQSLDPGEVAAEKARSAYALVHKPVIVEDTALHIKALNGFPGALIKHMEESLGLDGICRLLDAYSDRSAKAETCIAFYNGSRLMRFYGAVEGMISDKPRGGGGFGWDSIFIPDGMSKTFAEMGTDEKNRISHRRKAVMKLRRHLMGR